ALAGTGVGADAIDYVLGIAKAYATRVGGGPFPTELHDEVGQGIRDRSQEYGATTGRPRRCGWMDVVALKRAVAINGITGLCITKLDILDGMETLKICIAYEYHGKRSEYAPLDAQGWDECTPVYLEFPGWPAARGRSSAPARTAKPTPCCANPGPEAHSPRHHRVRTKLVARPPTGRPPMTRLVHKRSVRIGATAAVALAMAACASIPRV